VEVAERLRVLVSVEVPDDDTGEESKAKINGVRGKGRTSRTVFLGADGRTALAD